MPGHYVEQIVLRASITDRNRAWCAENLAQGRGVVVLYCTSTFRQDPMCWEVYAQIETTALMGAQAYAYAGLMPYAVELFYGMTIVSAQLIIVAGLRHEVRWWVYPELIWGRLFVAHGRYFANFEGDVDFYFQDQTSEGSDLFHHVTIYGGPQDPVTGLASPSHWYRGERRYIRSVVDAGWMRDHIL